MGLPLGKAIALLLCLVGTVGACLPAPKNLAASTLRSEPGVITAGGPRPVVDWRSVGSVTAPMNQGNIESCWAVAAVGAIEAQHKSFVGKLVTLSSQQVFDCAGRPGPSTYIKAFEWVKENGGIASAETYPYVGRVQVCKRGAKKAAVILGYRANIHTERDLMRAVSRQPVAVTMMLDGPSFYAYRGGIFTGPCGKVAHAMLVVGYGATADGRGYWIVKNSYGVNWGDHGYFFVQRGPENGGGLCGVATWGAYPA